MNKSRRHNPWAGLSSYPDPETGGKQLIFCGREDESYDVARLIDNNIFVTLYGRSGTGKTSLLNAGVFPLLRQKGYFPVSIRLGMDALDISFQQGIIQKLCQALTGIGEIQTREVIPMPDDVQSIEYLWRYFARTRFTDISGHVLFPVVVLDQFEEVFRTRREDAEALLRQIHFMMDESHALDDRLVDGQPYSYDFNYRFVVAIREDDLYRLEDSIDNNYLPEMKRCRFRLRNLSEEGAREVVLIPGGDCFAPETKDQIADLLIGMAKSREDQTVSAVVLSLVCSRIFDDFLRSGADHISVPLVEQFIKGNPFERYYYEATEGLTRKERAYIEKNLVDSTGHRDSIPESDFFRVVKNGAQLFEGSKKILQRVSTSSGGGSYRIELLHDSFCEPLAILKEKRELRERSRWLFIAMGVALLSFFVGFHFVRLNRTVTRQKQALEMTTGQLRSDSLVLAQHIERIQKDSLEMSRINSNLEQEKDFLDEANRKLYQRNKELEEERSARKAASAENMALKEEIIERDEEQRNLKDVIEAMKGLLKESNNLAKNKAIETREALSNHNPSEKEFDIKEVQEGVYEMDGLQYTTDSPTNDDLREWASVSKNICNNKIQGKTDNFSIPETMMKEDPCLVYLLLNSDSITPDKEKQGWFDLYKIMNEGQKMKLYNILYREKYKLAGIQLKYEKKQAEIEQKYDEVIPEYQKYRNLAKLHPDSFFDLYAELQDQLLGAYAELGTKSKTYEVLLSEALEDSEFFYQKDSSKINRYISMKNQMGLFKLHQRRISEAMAYLESAYQMDPVASASYLAQGYNGLAYQYTQEKDYETALETIEKAIGLQPLEADYYDSKGEILLMKGDRQGAIEMWHKVLELDPKFLSRFKNGTAFYRQLKEKGLIQD